MACNVLFILSLLANVALLGRADELAWGDLSADGSLEMRHLDVPVATARGADNLYIPNPMDSHDWSHTSVARNTLSTEIKNKAKVKLFEEELKPIFSAMPKDTAGHLNNSTARYALHRYFSQKKGWSIKGLEPAGASWQATMSVTPDVKDITKYMVPSYLQQLIAAKVGDSGLDLHNLAVLASVIDHMVHAEMLTIVYSIFTTLELTVPGKKTEKEVNDVIDTFLMVFAFGINLDVSMLADVQKAKEHLEKTHSGWPQLQSFAAEVRKQSSCMSVQLDFNQIVQLTEKIADSYSQWQGQDCARVKDELVAKPSHREGRVQFSEVTSSESPGRRSLLTENFEELSKLGVIDGGSQASATLIIPNYVNSQSMCLSTASMYNVCCMNECDSLLGSIEREAARPAVSSGDLLHMVKALPGTGIAESLLQELPRLADSKTALIPLHGRAFASWMHRAFPLACPAPHDQKIANPKTADEWMGESGQEVSALEDMMTEVAEVLARYTTMGKNFSTQVLAADEEISSASDVVTIRPVMKENFAKSERSLIGTVVRFAAMISMIGIVALAAKPVLKATTDSKAKGSGMMKELV